MADRPRTPIDLSQRLARVELPGSAGPQPAAEFQQRLSEIQARKERRQHAARQLTGHKLGVAGLRAGEAVAEAKGKERLALGLRFAADYWKLKNQG